ncbi:MAG: OmpH family outer membrane protein [Pseudomonadota bacterium]|nr:OmpH family outer membrane protein [Pseudomonadota bacterium]
MKHDKIFGILLLAAFIMLACPLLSFAQKAPGLKIAYIDLQKVMGLSEAGKQSREILEKKRADLGKKIKELEMQLNQKKTDLERQGMMLSAAARADKESEYQKEVRNFKLFVSDSEKELKKTYQELTKSILKELEKVIVKFGNEGNYSMILGKQESSIFYADKTYDVSQQVIDAYNKWKKEQSSAEKKK